MLSTPRPPQGNTQGHCSVLARAHEPLRALCSQRRKPSSGALPLGKSLVGLLQGPTASKRREASRCLGFRNWRSEAGGESPLLAGRQLGVTELPGRTFMAPPLTPFFPRAGGGRSRAACLFSEGPSWQEDPVSNSSPNFQGQLVTPQESQARHLLAPPSARASGLLSWIQPRPPGSQGPKLGSRPTMHIESVIQGAGHQGWTFDAGNPAPGCCPGPWPWQPLALHCGVHSSLAPVSLFPKSQHDHQGRRQWRVWNKSFRTTHMTPSYCPRLQVFWPSCCLHLVALVDSLMHILPYLCPIQILCRFPLISEKPSRGVTFEASWGKMAFWGEESWEPFPPRPALDPSLWDLLSSFDS